MELTFNQMSAMADAFEELKNTTLPFKLSLLLAKNQALIAKEIDFYVEQEREFAQKYLAADEQGQFIQEQPGVFRIKDGLQEECRQAREELDKFTTNIELRKIPLSLIEDLKLTPAQVGALEDLIDEEG